MVKFNTSDAKKRSRDATPSVEQINADNITQVASSTISYD